MFHLEPLTIGAYYWIIEAINNSLKPKDGNINLPKRVKYKGRFTPGTLDEDDSDFFLFESNELEIKVNYIDVVDKLHARSFNVDSHIIAPTRQRVFKIISNLSHRLVYNDVFNGAPKEYINVLHKKYPELII